MQGEISVFSNLLPVDPNKPKDDDEECDGGSDSPKDPKLGGYDEPPGSVGCVRVERTYTEDGLSQIRSVKTSGNNHIRSAQRSRLDAASTLIVDWGEWAGE